MKSVLITFDQAYYERIMLCWTVWVVGASPIWSVCRDVVRRPVIRISAATPGLVCVRPS